MEGTRRSANKSSSALPGWLHVESALDGNRAIVEFSHAYAEQNERDYQKLVAAVESGQITAQVGA